MYRREKLNSFMEAPSISIVEKSIVDNAAVNCLLVSLPPEVSCQLPPEVSCQVHSFYYGNG